MSAPEPILVRKRSEHATAPIQHLYNHTADMKMNFINFNYVSLQDLDDLDSKIAKLVEEKRAITQEILVKSSGEHGGVSAEVPQHALSLVKTIENFTSETFPESIKQLILKEGSLNVLTRLESLLNAKHSLLSRCSSLESGIDLENLIARLSSDSSVDDFTNAIQRANEMDDKEIVDNFLHVQLGDAISKKRGSISSLLSSTLSAIRWLSPKEKITIESEKLQEISRLFHDLVELQASSDIPHYPKVWWALETLLNPFFLRFQFHFQDTAETNKLTKPEWALNYVEEFLKESLPALEFVVGDSFLKYDRIGTFEIIATVLMPLREKLRSMLKVINQKIEVSQDDESATDQFGRLLSHLIFEVTSFDQRLRNSFKYNPFAETLDVAPVKKWMGLTGDILVSSETENVSVNNWLSLELRLAKKRFDTEIISPENAFDIDYEFLASSDSPESLVKPTYSAYGLAKLFDSLTSHFKTINIVKYQLKFISQIQLVFLDQYLEQLQNQFRSFNEFLGSKFIASFMPTQSKSDANASSQAIVANGLTGLAMITGIYCSTKFVIEKMEEWAEHLVYIQLWNFCQDTSGNPGNSIFDTPIHDYKLLLSKVSSKYEDFFRKEIRSTLKEYVNVSTWNIEDPSYQAQISQSLSNFTTIIPAYASYLKKALPEIDYFIVSSRICDSYFYVLLEYIVTNNQFNERGLEQLKVDIEYLSGILKDYLMLDQLHKYSNAENKTFKKFTQSIDVMSRFDATGAKLLKKQFQNGESVRAHFDNRLDCLSDSECLDLLFRII